MEQIIPELEQESDPRGTRKICGETTLIIWLLGSSELLGSERNDQTFVCKADEKMGE